MAESGRRSNTGTIPKNNKQKATTPAFGGRAACSSVDSSGANIAQQLQEISAKLSKLDELERLNKELLKTVLQLSNRVDVITVENRLLKQEIADLKQSKHQKEVLIKGVKLQHPKQHLEVCQKVCEVVGFQEPESIREVRPIVFKNNEWTDGVLVKFWRVEGKSRFFKCLRSLKKPLSPRDLGIKSRSKLILVQDRLTPEKQKIHNQTRELCKLGLQHPWIFRGSTWITHPETKQRHRVADSADVVDIEFLLVTQQNSTVVNEVTETEH